MANDTALGVLHEILAGVGGSTDSQTIVPALEELNQLIGAEGLDQYVYAWLDEHGATAGYSVTNGDLSITLS